MCNYRMFKNQNELIVNLVLLLENIQKYMKTWGMSENCFIFLPIFSIILGHIYIPQVKFHLLDCLQDSSNSSSHEFANWACERLLFFISNPFNHIF